MKSYVLALDLGGTNSVLGVVDPSGKIVCTDSFKTQAYPELDDYVEQCAVVAEGLYAQVGGKEQIEAFDLNDSIIHIDFMIGSADLNIKAILEDGNEITIFDEGTWAI